MCVCVFCRCVTTQSADQTYCVGAAQHSLTIKRRLQHSSAFVDVPSFWMYRGRLCPPSGSPWARRCLRAGSLSGLYRVQLVQELTDAAEGTGLVVKHVKEMRCELRRPVTLQSVEWSFGQLRLQRGNVSAV